MYDVNYCIHCGDRIDAPPTDQPIPGHGTGRCVYSCRYCGKEVVKGLHCECARARARTADARFSKQMGRRLDELLRK